MVHTKFWIVMALTVMVCVSCFSPLTGNEEGETGSVEIRIGASSAGRAVVIPYPPADKIGEITHTITLTRVELNSVEGAYEDAVNAPFQESREISAGAASLSAMFTVTPGYYAIEILGTWNERLYSYFASDRTATPAVPGEGVIQVVAGQRANASATMGKHDEWPVNGLILTGSAEDLAKIGVDPAFPLDGNYVLTNDLSLSGAWTPVGDTTTPFTGTFDGQGNTITGLTINAPAGDNQGLFGVIGVGSDGIAGTVKNLMLEAANINAPASTNVAAIAGTVVAGAAIENCSVSGTIKGTDNIGAIAGNNDGTVSNCYAAGNVESDVAVAVSNAGGIAGRNDGVVEYCFSSNTVKARNMTGPGSGHTGAGGIAGWGSGRISNCYATGDVTSESSGTDTHAGGIAGYISGGARIEYCYASGTVTAIETGSNSWGGGIIGLFGAGTPSAEYCVALNLNLNVTSVSNLAAVHPARIANEGTPLPPPTTLSNNYARADMMFNNAVNTWLTGSVDDPQNLNGADITNTETSDAAWWQDTANGPGFDPAIWDFTDLTGNKMPILNQDFFPAGTQQTAPVVVLP